MTEPYKLTLSQGEYQRSGIVLSYTQRTRSLDAYGWYDTFVGIEGGSLTLAELFQQLHIPPSHVRAALKEME